MATKIYVGNISYNTTDEQLSDLFRQYGTVLSSTIIFDRFTNRSKGFGFVEMEDDDSAQQAIAALDGHELDRRALRINVAQEKESRPPRRNNYRDNPSRDSY